jgi:hypothetical protein
MIEFVTIPKNEYEILTKAKDSMLTSLDGELLIENREVFKKFLRKAQFSYQISLSE